MLFRIMVILQVMALHVPNQLVILLLQMLPWGWSGKLAMTHVVLMWEDNSAGHWNSHGARELCGK